MILSLNSRRKLLLPRVDMFRPSIFTLSKSSQTRQAWTELTFQIVPRRPISITAASKIPLKCLLLQAFHEISSISPSAFLTSLKSSQGRWIQHETMFSNRPTKANFHASASKKPAQHACIYRLFSKFHPFFAAHF